MILYAVNHIANWGVASFAFLSCFLLGIVALVFFIYLQNHIKQALIPLSLFKNKRYLTVIVLCCGEQYVFAAVLYSVGVYLQAIRHFSSELSGLILMSMTLPYLLSPLAGKMLDKKGPRQPLFLAVVSMLLGVLLLTSITYFHALIYIIAALFLIGIGVGFVLVVINAECVNCVAQELSGIASGTYLTIAVFALSVGLYQSHLKTPE